MKGKTTNLIIIVTILFNIFLLNNINNKIIDSILLNKTAITVDFSDSSNATSINIFIDKINEFSEKNNIEIAQYSFLSKNQIDIYSTKKDIYNNILNIPKFILNKDIKIHKFEDVLDVGFKNILYVDTKDYNVIRSFSDAFNNEYKIYFLNTNYNYNSYNISNFLPIFFCLISIIIVTFYYYFTKQHYFLYKVFGYNDIKIYFIINKNIFFKFIKTSILSNLILTAIIYNTVFSKLHLKVFLSLLKASALIIFIVFLLSIPLYFIFFYIISNRKINNNIIIVISYFIRFLVLFLIIVLCNNIIINIVALKDMSKKLLSWENTKNLYNLYETYSPLYDNLESEDNLNEKKFMIYNNLSSLDKVFIIKTNNFERSSNIQNIDYDYNYKFNVKKETDLYSPYGKNIVVDKNYLNRHIIKTTNGKNVINMIDDANNTLNILVPQKFSNYETFIKTSFTKWFYFQKVDVPNIYREVRGEEKIKKNINDLRVNIIYIENDKNIFTYNTNSGDSYNNINNTIITVYTGNIDNSFLASCFGNYMFIESSDQYSALKEINNVTKQYNVTVLDSIASVYDKKGEEISNLESTTRNLIINTIILFCFFIISMIVVTYTFYKSYLETIIIKSFHGHNFFQIYKKLFLINISSNIIILFFTGIIYKDILFYIILIIALALISDYSILNILNRHLIKKGELKAIKKVM